MRKAVVIAVISIVFLVLCNAYYYWDTYRGQVEIQNAILHKQAKIVGAQLTLYFKKIHTNISLLLSDNEMNKLFAGKGYSVEVQKRLELLFTSYSDCLNVLKVQDLEGNVFELRRGPDHTFISTFSKGIKEEIVASHTYINPHGTKITYIQPLFNHLSEIGYVQFEISLDAFFNSAFFNFNLEDVSFQWVMKPNGWVVYNSLHENLFYPVLDDLNVGGRKLDNSYLIHAIHTRAEKLDVLTVFKKLEFSGNDYYLAFSMPIDVITSSMVRNSIVFVVVSLFVVVLIVFVSGFYLKRHMQDEKSLKKSEDALRKIVYYLPVGVVMLDQIGRIRQVNRAALKLFAFDGEDQLIGRLATEDILFENKQRIEKTAYSALSNKYIFTNKNNEESVILHEKIPFFLLREEYSLQVFVEVSLLEKERKSEEMANKAKSTFIANISHELRTPLNSVIGMTDILSSSDLKSEDREMLNVVKRSADTLLVLINDILDFSKIESGHLEIESIPFDMKQEVEDCIQCFLPNAQSKNLKLSLENNVVLPENYLGDPLRFRQVLNNLYSNAIKFTEKGEVLLTINETRGLNGSPAIVFTLKDTGIGVKKEKLNLIFNAFSQVDESTTRKYGGTGLGLTISKQLVDLMGGEIWVESPSGLSRDQDCPGAAFSFTMPCLTQSHRKDYNYNHITSFNMIKAFVITDDVLYVRTLLKNLQALQIGYKVLLPSNDAIDIIRADNKHHLLIVDHRPDFNGLEFLQELYNHRLHKRMPVILQSSDFESTNTSVAKRLGADAYFRNPVHYSILKEFILKFFPQVVKESFDLKDLKSISVLVAEDNVLNQRLARNLFRKIGHEIDVASNGMEAVRKVQEKKYDIVFMDLMMPEMDGVAAMKQIKKELAGCPVIAMTASVDESDRHVVMEAGMDDFITKPTRLDDLSRMLDKWCKYQ